MNFPCGFISFSLVIFVVLRLKVEPNVAAGYNLSSSLLRKGQFWSSRCVDTALPSIFLVQSSHSHSSFSGSSVVLACLLRNIVLSAGVFRRIIVPAHEMPRRRSQRSRRRRSVRSNQTQKLFFSTSFFVTTEGVAKVSLLSLIGKTSDDRGFKISYVTGKMFYFSAPSRTAIERVPSVAAAITSYGTNPAPNVWTPLLKPNSLGIRYHIRNRPNNVFFPSGSPGNTPVLLYRVDNLPVGDAVDISLTAHVLFTHDDLSVSSSSHSYYVRLDRDCVQASASPSTSSVFDEVSILEQVEALRIVD